MPTFAYSALNPDGSRTTGEISAGDKVAALDQVVAKGLTPLDIQEGRGSEPWWNRDIALFGTSQLKPQEIEGFFSALAAMLNAQTPLPRALRFCADLTSDKVMRSMLGDAIAAVEDGMPLADALSKSTAEFPPRLINMIALGEASNSLPAVVSRAAAMLETEARMRREVQQALIYPLILLGMSMFVLGILIFYLAPTLAPVFVSADASPPLIIRAMIHVQRAVVTDWPIALLGILIVGALSYAAKPIWKVAAQRGLNLFPVTRRYLAKRETLRFCQTLYLMLTSGDQLANALKTAAETTTQPAWRTMLTEAHRDIEAGATMSTSLLQNPLIDPMARTILITGEESDQLVEVLGPAIATLQSQTAQTLSQAVKLLTPILTLVIGLAVGGIILSTISAIMDLNDVVF